MRDICSVPLFADLLLFALVFLLRIGAAVGEDFPRVDEDFSGVYSPNPHYSAEIYGASWLASVEALLDLRPRLDEIHDLEGASFFIVDVNCKKMFYIDQPDNRTCDVLKRRATLMTRDYFDFQVEHLSSTTNNLNKENFRVLLPGLQCKAAKMKQVALKARSRSANKRRLDHETIAIMPVSVNPVHPHTDPKVFWMAERIRFLFFKLTFWSIYRHIPNIVVSYHAREAVKWIERTPQIWKVLNLTMLRNPILQPKATLQAISDALLGDKSYSRFRYVYFSEADQILHLRRSKEILDVIDGSLGRFSFTPHRMNTYLLPQALGEDERRLMVRYPL